MVGPRLVCTGNMAKANVFSNKPPKIGVFKNLHVQYTVHYGQEDQIQREYFELRGLGMERNGNIKYLKAPLLRSQ